MHNELIDAIKALPSNKAARIDGIPEAFFKANKNQGACSLQPLIHEAWVSESFQNECSPKKRNLRECGN